MAGWRVETSVVVFYLWLNAAAVMLEEVGFTDALGIGYAGVGDGLSGAMAELSSIQAGAGNAETLLAVFAAVTNAFQGIIGGLFAGPRFMLALGIPEPFVAFLMAPLGLIIGRGVIYMISGREL